MPLILPNTIDPDTTADAIEVEQNNGVLTQYVNTNVITRDGAVAMTNPLLLAGDPTQPNHAANKGYADQKVAKTGDTMTGLLSMTTSSEAINAAGNIRSGQQVVGNVMYVTGAQVATGNALARKDYVDGRESAITSAYQAADTYYYNTYTYPYYQAALNADTSRVARTGDIMSGSLQVDGNPFSGVQPGALVAGGGVLCSAVYAAGNNNLYCYRAGGAFGIGEGYITFFGQTGAAFTGMIAIASGSSVSYNTTSDYRLKDELGPVDDPVGRLLLLQPKHLRWKSDQTEFDGFIAHEVDEVVPYAVMGEKDALDDEGNIKPQQFDSGNLIPLLTAALQDAHTKIADLTTRLEALEAA